MAYTNRKEIPEKYKWNLGDIFATPEDWQKAFDEISASYTELAAFSNFTIHFIHPFTF